MRRVDVRNVNDDGQRIARDSFKKKNRPNEFCIF